MEFMDRNWGAVSLALRRGLPACEGVSGRTRFLTVGLHLDAPARIIQRREDGQHDALFRPGQLTVIPAGMFCECTTGGPVSFLHVGLGDGLLGCDIDDLPRVERSQFLLDDPLLRELLMSLVPETDSGDPLDRLYAEHVGRMIWLRLLRAPPAEKRSAVAPLSPRLIRRLDDFMDARLADPPSLVELAHICGLGVDHFIRQFRRTTGRTPYVYFQERRMRQAGYLLLARGASVTSVAMAMGFSNPSKFSAAFRRTHGIAPGAWRRRAAIGADMPISE